MREREHTGRRRSGQTLHDATVDEGARLLMDGLRDRGLVPAGCPVDTVRRVCRRVQSEWLRGENVIPLFKGLLAEARRRLVTAEEAIG